MDLSDASEKIPSDTIDPGTFRLVAQRLKHYATPRPHYNNKVIYILCNYILVYIQFLYNV
jgi:hypothetical protein